MNLINLNFPHNGNYVNSLEINVRKILPFSVSMAKMALAPTLAQGVKPHEHRRRPPMTIEKKVQKRNCKETRFPCPPSHPLLPWAIVLCRQDTPCRRTSLGRSRSTTPTISSKLSRRFLLRRTRLAFLRSCFWPCGLPPVGTSIIDSKDFGNLPTMISAAVSAIDFALDIFFLFILSKNPTSSPLPFMRLKAHGSFGQTFGGWTVFPSNSNRKSAIPFKLYFARRAACQIHENSTLFIWLGMSFLHRNEFYEEWNSVSTNSNALRPAVFTEFMKINNKRKALL